MLEVLLFCKIAIVKGGNEMRFMIEVLWDVEKGNEPARKGALGKTFVNMDDASQIPAVAEPWLLTLHLRPYARWRRLCYCGMNNSGALESLPLTGSLDIFPTHPAAPSLALAESS